MVRKNKKKKKKGKNLGTTLHLLFHHANSNFNFLCKTSIIFHLSLSSKPQNLNPIQSNAKTTTKLMLISKSSSPQPLLTKYSSTKNTYKYIYIYICIYINIYVPEKRRWMNLRKLGPPTRKREGETGKYGSESRKTSEEDERENERQRKSEKKINKYI